MKKIIPILVLLVGIFSYGQTLATTQVSCSDSRLSGNTQGCDSCFIGSSLIYQGVSYRVFDRFMNNTSNTNIYHRPGDSIIYYENLQEGKLVFDFPKKVEYSSRSNKYLFNYPSLGGQFYKFGPGDQERLIQAESLVLSNVNTLADKNKFGAKIIYDIGYYSAIKGKAPNVSGNSTIHRECIFYNIGYCGDGQVTNNEVCDPNDLTKTGWGNGGCSSTCTAINTPINNCENGGVGGNVTFALNQNTPGLCKAGEAVGNFLETLNGRDSNYSWTCNGVSGGNCSAVFSGNGGQCLNGGVGGVVNTPLTSATPGLCQAGYPVRNFLQSVTGNTTNYLWDCGTFSGGNCNATYNGNTGASCQNGGVGGNITNSINQDTPGLCKAGDKVGDFNVSVEGITTKFSWSCAGLTGGTCNATYGGNGGQCANGGVSGSQSSPISSSTPGLCQAGYPVRNFLQSVTGNTTNYLWDCGTFSGGNCNASYINNGSSSSSSGGSSSSSGGSSSSSGGSSSSSGGSSSSSGGSSSSSGGSSSSSGGSSSGGPTTYCGDGILQRPNTSLFYEQCDFSSNRPDWCNADCTIKNTSIPGSGDIDVGPNGSLVIGNNMDVFTSLPNNTAYIKNNSSSDIFIDDRLCVKQVDSQGVISGSNIVCSNSIIGKVTSGSTFSYDMSNKFTGDTSSINIGNTFENAKLITKVESYPSGSIFNGELKIKVAKPSVSTFGGGASLLNGNNLSDVSQLDTTTNKNKNLILTSIGDNPLSSYVYKTDDFGIISRAKTDGDKDLIRLENIDSQNGPSKVGLPNQKFNGLDDVFVHNGNVDLNIFNDSSITKNTTYIINGNLTINTDIKTSKNILFVVKGGNITINVDVKQIDAVLISLISNGNGGQIKSSGETNNQLNVNGALYGDIRELLASRTFIKSDGDYVKVGTNVNFSSKIFSNPPPLLSKFLQEYLEVEKIAK